jgi:hypothetical protein
VRPATAELLLLNPHRVLFAVDIAQHEELKALAERCLSRNIEVLQVPALHHSYPGQVGVKELLGVPLLGLGSRSLDGWELVVKNVLDRAVAAAAGARSTCWWSRPIFRTCARFWWTSTSCLARPWRASSPTFDARWTRCRSRTRT